MNAERSHERFEELAVGHALAALEPEDEQTFLLHLRGCAACERAVAANSETLKIGQPAGLNRSWFWGTVLLVLLNVPLNFLKGFNREQC